MPLHDTLRELVQARGIAVTADAAELRGALDDFLDEDDATVGEVNLLVDAVRLGALNRLLDLLDHGADPLAAVGEAGAGLARDRGSDDDRRSRWAVAVLGYAVGRLEMGAIPTHTMEEPPPASSPSSASSEPDANPADLTTVAHAGSLGLPVPTGQPPPTSHPVPAYPPPPVARREPRRGAGLIVLTIAIVLGLVAGVGFAVWKAQRSDDGGATDDRTPTGEGSPDSSGATIPKDAILVPYRDDAGAMQIYEVDSTTGRWKVVVEGNAQDLPTVAPDRTRMSYQDRSEDGFPVLELVDVGTGEVTEPFPATGPCAHAFRPGWSLDGEQFAIVCTGADDVGDGVFLCRSDGSDAQRLIKASDLRGSPTWVDDHRFVYGRDDATTGADTLWTYDVDTAQSEPLLLPDAPDAHLTHADWSPAAGQLLFLVHGSDDLFGRIWVGGPDLSDARPLGTTDYAHPVWSPDGSRIAAIWRDPDADGALRLVTIDVEHPDEPQVLDDLHAQPNGEPTIPVWASR